MKTIAFTGGGSGGHIYPGLAVAARVAERVPARIVWIGSDRGMDRSIVEAAGFEFFGIPTGKFRRSLSARNFTDLFRILGGFFAARKLLKSIGPSLLFSKGGFVSVPPCAAAASLGIPVFTHESDFSPGLATKINLRFARRVFLAYAETADSLPEKYRALATVSGNPIRADFHHADEAAGRAFLALGPEERILVALGGSQGARQVNALIRDALPELMKEHVVVHQTGKIEGDELPPARDRYRPFPYIGKELPHILKACELVVGRSGAGTVWEAAVLGKPMVLIPLSGSGTRGDQVENAEYVRRKGAGLVLSGQDASASGLAAAVAAIGSDPARRSAMAAASRSLASTDAVSIIAEAIADSVQSHAGGEGK